MGRIYLKNEAAFGFLLDWELAWAKGRITGWAVLTGDELLNF